MPCFPHKQRVFSPSPVLSRLIPSFSNTLSPYSGLKEPGLATIVKILNALNISADELLCDLVPSASHVTDDEISKRLEGLTPMQKKVALDLLDTYITNLPYLTKEE